MIVETIHFLKKLNELFYYSDISKRQNPQKVSSLFRNTPTKLYPILVSPANVLKQLYHLERRVPTEGFFKALDRASLVQLIQIWATTVQDGRQEVVNTKKMVKRILKLPGCKIRLLFYTGCTSF